MHLFKKPLLPAACSSILEEWWKGRVSVMRVSGARWAQRRRVGSFPTRQNHALELCNNGGTNLFN